jgi:hypothetical protein
MNDEIEKKKAYIKWYREEILGKYVGRWYNMGLTHIEKEEAELQRLEEEYEKSRIT